MHQIHKTKYVFLMGLLTLFCLYACDNTNTSNLNKEKTAQSPIRLENESGTQKMALELENLLKNGDPINNYHWNKKRADLYRSQLKENPNKGDIKLWFKYINELLNAGSSEQVIKEIESISKNFGGMKPEMIQKSNKAIFDLYALAYLRLGEQQNCQANHNSFSCILPIQEPAFHLLPQGSQKAIEWYEAILTKFPEDLQSRWLLNLAYMTLGQHPSKVPSKWLLSYPNWALETKEFPFFNEVAMSMGLAVDGLSGGTCIDDFNGDGYLDIFATSYNLSDPVKLFINNQKGEFIEKDTGLKGISGGLNTIHADYDNDGDRDILVLRGGWLKAGGNHPNSLLKNNGDGTFIDVTYEAGLASFHPTQTAAWGDFNNDGWLDLFIGNESEPSIQNPSELYKNNGDGTFTEVSKSVGLNINRYVKGVAWGDINNDGWQDLYVSILGSPNLLFKNNKGQFQEIGQKAGVSNPVYSFPCWFWDMDNDGDQDIFVANYELKNLQKTGLDFSKDILGDQPNGGLPKLYKNNGDETFTEVSKAFNLNHSMYAMGCNFGDLDNDGFLDMYVGTGTPYFNSISPNRMFKNTNGLKFEEITSAGGFGHIQKGHGIGFGDLNNDGDQDIYAIMGGAFEGDNFTNVLFENPGFENDWIALDLIGVKNNRDGIGTKIQATTTQKNGKIAVFHQTVNTGGSFGASSLRVEMGLNQVKNIDELKVIWQDGQIQIFNNVAANQFYTIKENEQNINPKSLPSFTFVKNKQGHHHH